MDTAQARIREYARWLDENHDLATGVLDDLVSNIVGTGVGVEPMAKTAGGDPAQRVNDQLSGLWSEFWASPEVTGELPGTELERLVCRTWLRDGELFLQHLTTPAVVSGSPLGYLVAPLEGDFVPFDEITTDPRAVHGIVKDGLGRPLAYHVYKTHPGNLMTLGGYSGLTPETVVVAAANMTHIKFARRLLQTRGVSIFHSVFTRLDDIKDYEESERIAARVAAAFTAYIKKGEAFEMPSDTSTGDRQMEMAPGMIFDNLLPGEDVGTIDPKRPNNDVENYIAIQERRIAAGTGTRYSAVARNYNGTYSSQRQELVEGAVHYRRLFSYLAQKFYLPVWQRFIDAARLSGRLRLTPGIDEATLYRPQLRAPSLPWIDPLKEIQAHGMAVEHGFRARAQVIRDLGGDPREVDALLAADELDLRPPAPPQDAQDDEEDQDQDQAA
jgi:lambda family phage portal protein